MNKRILYTFALLSAIAVFRLPDASAQQKRPGPVIPQSSVSESSEGKFALLIGIDEYEHLERLKGAVHDVTELKKLLTSKKFGFAPKNVIVITNAQGTADKILQAFHDHLINNARIYKEKTGKEAIIFFHYSGHGSQVPSTDPKEPDGKDETIVPVNSRDNQNKNYDIIDDQIEMLITELAMYTSQATYVFDSCHSGTINRGQPEGPISRSVSEDKRPQPKRKYVTRTGQARSESGDDFIPAGENYVLIAASRSNEKAYERPDFDGNDHGYLTYYLLQELSKLRSDTTYRGLINRVSMAVAQKNEQHPQLLGNGLRTVMGGRILDEDHYIQVTGIDSNRITIAAGAAMGIKPGTRVAFYSPETTRLSGDLGRLFENSVDSVTGNESIIPVPQNIDSTKLTADMKAVIVSPLSGKNPIVVVVDESEQRRERGGPSITPPAVLQMIERVKNSQLVKILLRKLEVTRGASDQSIRADVYFKRGRFGDVFRDGKPVPQKTEGKAIPPPLPRDDSEVYYLTSGTNNRPLYDFFVEVDSSQASTCTAEALEKIAKLNNLRDLENYSSPLNDAVSVNFFKVTGKINSKNEFIQETESELSMSDPQAGFSLAVGEFFKIKVRNNSPQELFVSVINLSSDGSIKLMYPGGADREALNPGKYAQTPTYVTSLPLGREYFRIILTTKPTDFSPLNQDAIKYGGAACGSFGGRRSGPTNVAYDNSDWGTTQISLVITGK